MSRIMQDKILPDEEKGTFLPESTEPNGYDKDQKILDNDEGYLMWLSKLEEQHNER